MLGKMLNPRLVHGLSALAAAAAIAACSNGMETPHVPVTQARIAIDRAPHHKKPKCLAPIDKVPGTYTHFTTFGTLRGTRYESDRTALVSNWARAKYVAATPGPTPTASAPPPAPSYVYYGVYKLKKGGIGCAYFITATSGRAEFGAYNGATLGLPHFSEFTQPQKPVASGEALVVLKHLSASGGKGTVTLKTLSGKVYDSGPITLAGRVVVQ
jgi:hypothetical protein